jgi:hypothetical protein
MTIKGHLYLGYLDQDGPVSAPHEINKRDTRNFEE